MNQDSGNKVWFVAFLLNVQFVLFQENNWIGFRIWKYCNPTKNYYWKVQSLPHRIKPHKARLSIVGWAIPSLTASEFQICILTSHMIWKLNVQVAFVWRTTFGPILLCWKVDSAKRSRSGGRKPFGNICPILVDIWG